MCKMRRSVHHGRGRQKTVGVAVSVKRRFKKVPRRLPVGSGREGVQGEKRKKKCILAFLACPPYCSGLMRQGRERGPLPRAQGEDKTHRRGGLRRVAELTAEEFQTPDMRGHGSVPAFLTQSTRGVKSQTSASSDVHR